ncbi:MAG: hypothetical protein GY851_21020 [bacterium]|nr:hypothetical protein [bacterium]
MKMCSSLALVVVLVLASSGAEAAVLFTEDWEVADVDVTASATVTGTGATYDVTTVGGTPPQVDIVNGELVCSSTGSQYTLITSPADAYSVDLSAYSITVQLDRKALGNSPWAIFYLVDAAGENGYRVIYSYKTADGTAEVVVQTLIDGTPGNDAAIYLPADVVLDSWSTYTVKLTKDADGDIFELTADATGGANILPTTLAILPATTAATDLTQFAIVNLNQGSVGSYDNITISSETIDNARFSQPIVDRDSDSVVLAQEGINSGLGSTWELDFYRNLAYDCGLSGKYTFLVMEPRDNPGIEAPLWVHLHGGGIGYFDDQGDYHATGNQTQDTWNHEEPFENLRKISLHAIFGRNTGQLVVDEYGEPKDTTLVRRLMEGYRVLVVSLSDHDLYSGLGTPYPNNPNGGEVNGMQATMAAVDYTVANYPTTHVFAHGTSAGGAGVWYLATSYASEGTKLTGVVSDSGLVSSRKRLLQAAYGGAPGYPQGADFDLDSLIDKIGDLIDPSLPFHPEAQVRIGFDDVPILFMGGDADPFNAGDKPPIAQAAAAGLNNGDWVNDGIRQAVADQADSPHQVSIIDGAGHTPSNKEGVANDIVDDFINPILSASPPYPFDVDGDGLPDTFEQRIIDADEGDSITTIYDVLPGDDFDGDTYSNFDEWRNNTDPTTPDAPAALPGPKATILVCTALGLVAFALRTMRVHRLRGQ